MLIEKYQESGNFDLDNSEGSQARIKDDYKSKLDYILMILDYLGYGCETEIEEHITEKEIEKERLEKREAEAVVEENKNAKVEPFEYEVVSGKFFMRGECYRVGDKFKSHKDLTVHTTLRKV